MHIFNRGESRLDRGKIITMLEYSGLSYNDIQPEIYEGKVLSVNDIESDVGYSIRIFDDTLIITFRGSDSKKDWMFNLDFCKKVIPYNNFRSKIKVHSGFINAYRSRNVREKIRKFVTKEIRKIRLTGHSYGAALAILCAVDLQYSFNDRDYEVVVFGCPRIGNKAFRNSYNRRIFKTLRIENKNDIITKVPFRFMGYYHVGTRILIGRNSIFSLPGMNKHTLQEYYSNIWDV